MLNPLDDFLIQKVILLMTGVPGTVAMRDEISLLMKEGDPNKVSAFIDEVMAIKSPLAPGKPAEAAVQYVLDSGFSMSLTSQKIDQITADSLRQGIDSWTGLFSYAMDKVDNNVGKILGNRAEAADVFTGIVDELDVDVNVNHRLVQEWIDKIDASDESLVEAKDTVKDLIDELTTLPILIDSSPPDDSTAIAIDQDIVLTFNKKVTAGSGDILIVGSDGDTRTIAVTDSSQVTITGKTLTLNPTVDLHNDTVYNIRLDSGVIKDLVDHVFAGISDTTTLNFRTINTTPIIIPVTDTTAPTLTGKDPLDNATGVVEGKDVVLTFSEAVTAGVGNITIHNSIDPRDIRVIPVGDTSQIVFDRSTNTVRINPTGDLLPNAAYFVQIDPDAIKDLAGNSYAGIIDATTLNFDTVDTITPSLFGSDPVNRETGVWVRQDLTLTFDEAVKAGVGDIIISSSGLDDISISVTDNDQVVFDPSTNKVTINPTDDLLPNRTYSVQLASGVITDLEGNSFAGIGDFSGSAILQLTFRTTPVSHTLTTAPDDELTGTTDNDTFVGEFNFGTPALTTIDLLDTINGSGGTDTFKVFGNFDASATARLPSTILDIDTLYLERLTNADQDLSIITKSDTGISLIEIADASLLNGQTITTSTGQVLSLATAAGVGTAGAVTWAVPVIGDTTSLGLILNGYQGAATATPDNLTVTGAAATTTTLFIDSTGGANKIATFAGPATVTSHVINGDAPLNYTLAAADAARLSSIVADTNTGGVTVVANSALTKAGFTFMGGSGDDTISFINDEFGTLAAGAQLNGFYGTNKIGLFDTEVTAVEAAKIQDADNFQRIGLNAEITLDASLLSHYKTFDIDTAGLTQVINKLAAGSTINVGAGASAAFTATSLTTAGAAGVSDVTVNLGGAGDLFAHTITALVITGLTNVIISSNGRASNYIDAITNSDNSTFVVTGDTDLTMALAAGIAIASEVNANTFFGNLRVNGSSIIGSGDTITGGEGDDVIDGLKGEDILAGGEGADTFIFTSAAAANANGATFGTFDEIKGFVAGTDKLQFSTVDVVSGEQTAVQTAVTALAASSTAAQIATAMATANTTNLGVSFAVYEGNSYVLYETAGAGTGVVADDVFIKLTGVTTLPTFAGDVIA